MEDGRSGGRKERRREGRKEEGTGDCDRRTYEEGRRKDLVLLIQVSFLSLSRQGRVSYNKTQGFTSYDWLKLRSYDGHPVLVALRFLGLFPLSICFCGWFPRVPFTVPHTHTQTRTCENGRQEGSKAGRQGRNAGGRRDRQA